MHEHQNTSCISIHFSIVSSGSSVVSLVLFLAGTCFYVKKKPQRPSCGCSKSSRNHIHAEVRREVTTDIIDYVMVMHIDIQHNVLLSYSVI